MSRDISLSLIDADPEQPRPMTDRNSLALALTAGEQQELTALELVIERGLETFVEVGQALVHIRDQRLYRDGYGTFEDYCDQRWGMKRNYVNKIIAASGVVANLGTNVPNLPANEAQARPMTELEPEAQRLAWEIVKETAPAGKVTAAHVKSVVRVLKEVLTTGSIDNGEGISIPIAQATPIHVKAAVTEETYERMKHQETRLAERQQHRADLVDRARRASLLTGKYRVIYADPPWSYHNAMPPESTEPRDYYPPMPLEEICALNVKEIAADDAVLFLWTTSPHLEEAFQVIHAWGFGYKTSFVWDKVAHNVGHYNSVRHEFLLVTTRGACTPDVLELFDSVVSEERTEHSRKPEIFRQIIDVIYPYGARIELFARQEVEGWASWGNEVAEAS